MPEAAETFYPKTLIGDANMALTICEGAYTAHAPYHANIWNMIQQFDGRYPKDPLDLIDKGMDWLSNVPYRMGQTEIEEVATARLNMYKAAIYFSNICFRPWEDQYAEKPEYFFLANSTLSRNYAQRLSSLFIETLHRDPHFLTDFLLKLAHQQVAWGWATSVCREFSIFSEVPEFTNVYFERADKLENIKVFIEVFYQRAQDLFALWQKQEDLGWVSYKKEGIEYALRWAIQFEENKTYNSWQDILRTYQTTEIVAKLGKSPDISWAWIWNEEIEGGVTKTLFQWNRGQIQEVRSEAVTGTWAGNNSIMPNGTELAYQKHFKDLKVFDIFRVYPNSGINNTRVVQDYRGLGIFAYERDVEYNIKRNAINDALMVAMTEKYQEEYPGQAVRMEVVNLGPYSIIPAGFAALREDRTGNAIRYGIEMLGFERSEYMQLTESFNPQLTGRLPDRPTNDAVQALNAEVGQQRQDFATVPLDALQKELLAILKRMKEEYKKEDRGYDTWKYFYNRVVNEMFPQREFEGNSEVEKNNARKKAQKEFFDALVDSVDYLSLDYITSDINQLQMLFNLAQTPEGKEYFRRRMAFALKGSFSELQDFFPAADQPDRNINDSALAYIENALFWDTGEIAYNGLQNPVVHLEAHLTKGLELVRGIANGMDPVRIFNWLSNMLENAARHLQQLQTDPYQEDRFEEFRGVAEDLTAIADQIGKFAQQQAQEIAAQQTEALAANQQQSGMSPEQMAKIEMLEIQGREKMRRTEEQSRNKARQNQERLTQQLRQSEERHNQQMRQQAERFELQKLEMQQ